MKYLMTPHQYEAIKLQCEVITQIMQEPDCFIDLGPGRLYSEAWLIKHEWTNCRILGFEPSIKRYNKLLHEYPGELFPFAITDRREIIKGYEGDGRREGHATSDDFVIELNGRNEEVYEEVSISTSTLDIIDREYGPFEKIFIWADIEGSEMSALIGAKNILKSKVIGLNVETTQSNYYEIEEYLKQFGIVPVIWVDREQPEEDSIFIRYGGINEYRCIV